MKDYLVDVPVKTNIWIRPECQRRQFEVIRQARPSTLFVISDGGRNEEEWQIINAHRKMFDEEIDWNCKVYRLYEPVNRGMYAMIFKADELIWSTVDRCVFMEDDYVPSVSFFRFCAEMLDKYRDDLRISCICGMNYDGISEDVTSDYFFSRQGSIWGTAMWKRTYQSFDLSYFKDPYAMKTLKRAMKDNPTMRARLIGYSKSKMYEGHEAASEYYISSMAYVQNQLQIVPKYNLISNIGCQPSAAHSGSYETLPHGIRRVFNMKTYEMNFPLRHPITVTPDYGFEKRRNRILAFNHPWVRLYRKAEALFLNLKAGNYKRVKSKLQEYAKKITGRYSEK